MSVGPSGRIVIEVDPLLKKELYAALASRGLTLKQWFVLHATDFLATGDQLQLAFNAEVSSTQTTEKRKNAR